MKEKTPRNFCGLSGRYTAYESSAIVILPVPFDRTSTWMKGSRRGPRAMIDASRNLELYDIGTDSQVYVRGIHTAGPVLSRRPESMVARVHDRVARCLADGKFTVVLGGEHSVSVGSMAAHRERYPGMSVLHLDAHSDRRETYDGSPYSHACVAARAREMADTVVSVGIRSMDDSEKRTLLEDRVFYARECMVSDGIGEKVVPKLTGWVYVTIDLDVFDPGIMPSTGTPEPGGLGWYQVLDLLEEVVRMRHVVGFDVVELRPSGNRGPDFLAAKLVYRLLSLIFERGYNGLRWSHPPCELH
jgi:agmatinase